MSQEQTEHSVTLGALAKALAQAQAKLEDAKKDRTNPHFNSKYATLASVRAAMSDVLPVFGLAVVQSFEPHGDSGVCVVTTLLHESGEWMRSRLYLPVTKKDAQGFGSAISYARRYSLAAMVGIATADDDDGNEAVKPTVRKAAEVVSPSAAVDPAVERYVASIDVAADLNILMTVYNAVTADKALPMASRTYVVQCLSAKRKQLESKGVAA